ncbi:MAG TPA: hypothetical protein PKO06_00785 [Candidatus Ozemobacteraceae bacterium]|nr:hypothetical protein [Candidatus Ozemobacteraceae bacterium]
MASISRKNALRTLWLALVLTLVQAAVFAAALNVVYERVITDSWGNILGTELQTIRSVNDLPYGSPWRSYLLMQTGGRDLLSYSSEVARYLNQPLNITISDRNSVSNSSKSSDGYHITLFQHARSYSSEDSKKFIFLHEMGHVAMLNSYPGSYNFSGLNYGTDGVHYMDEILPNHKTAWVEGWANAFAALKNNGKVFSLDMKSDSIVAFLKVNTFEQMTRNELFIGKLLYDISRTFPSGTDKVYDVLARTGPHNSLRDFTRAYLSVYPGDQIGLARLLDKLSWGKISQAELLEYVNNGSSTVSYDFYQYLQSRSGTVASNNSTGSTKKGFWARVGDFFSNLFAGLFGRKDSAQTAASSAGVNTGSNALTPSGVSSQGTAALAPVVTGSPAAASSGSVSSALTPLSPEGIAQAQEDYFKAFAAYNNVLAKSDINSPEVKQALAVLQAAKQRLETIRQSIPQDATSK